MKNNANATRQYIHKNRYFKIGFLGKLIRYREKCGSQLKKIGIVFWYCMLLR